VVRLALTGVALVAGVALLAAALLRSQDPGLPHVERLELRGGLDTTGVRFGDAVPARLDVLVPRKLVDPASVRLQAAFEPYRVSGRLVPERVDDGGTTLLRYRFALNCLQPECLPDGEGPGFLFPQGLVQYREVGGGARTLSVSWPVLKPGSQLHPLDAGLLAWRADVVPPPDTDYRLPPRLLAVLLGALALACALGAAGLLVPRIVAALPQRSEVDRRSLLERALAAVRSAASADDAAERRRALDLLARQLRSGRDPRRAGTARRLAWSRRSPGRDDMERLADEVERSRA
jgi:hypothetical protein